MSGNLLLSQTDFTGGQVNNASRRQETQATKTGGAICKNWRARGDKTLIQRPGRRTLFNCQGGRTEGFRMAQNVEVLISFSAGAIAITAQDGTPALQVDGSNAAQTAPQYIWTDATLNQIYIEQALDDLVICYPGMRPQILRWDRPSNSWAFLQFAFLTSGNQVYEPFYRFFTAGASMSYSADNGVVTLTSSVNYFTANMVGSVMSIMGQQCTILQVISATQALANVSYLMADAIAVTVANAAPFQVGQIVENTGTSTVPYKFEIGSITPTTGTAGVIAGILMSSVTYPANLSSGDQLISPIGHSATTAVAQGTLPQPTEQWQEEFMSDSRGWPAACFYDQGRLGFCDFPQLGEAILWGAVNGPATFWIDTVAAFLQPEAGASADAAILEFIPQRPQVRHVVGWGDEFVFTDRGVYQIPVSTSNPLAPGSVEFRQFSNDGVSIIPPIVTQDAIVYINAGSQRCSCVRATGAYSRPYSSDDLSDEYSDLFNQPFAMTIATGDGQHPERYIYLVMADFTVVVGKFTADRTFVGWAPWVSQNPVKWVTNFGPDVYYTSAYGTGTFVEQEDDTIFMDSQLSVNVVVPNLAKPGGDFNNDFNSDFDFGVGHLWPLAGQMVTLMDGTLDRGDRLVTAAGYLVGMEGEDLSSPTLVVGLFTENRFQPFTPSGAGNTQYQGQRMRRRNIIRAQATVQNHSGFTLGNKYFPAYQFGEDQSLAPILKSNSYSTRTLGYSFDPTIDLYKDRPGPITLCELSGEVTP